MFKIGHLLNVLGVFLVALLLSGVTFFMFRVQGNGAEEELEWFGEMRVGEEIEVDELSGLSLRGRDAFYAFPGARFLADWGEDGHLDVQLLEGQVMFSALAGDLSVSIQTSTVLVESSFNSAYLDFEGGDLELYALMHPAPLTFLNPDNSEAMNALIVPSEHRMKVPSSKVTQVLQVLRLTKLSKEFPVFEFVPADLDSLVLSTYEGLMQAYGAKELEWLETLQSDGRLGPPQDGSAQFLYNFFVQSRALLTVLPHAKEDLQVQSRGQFLAYAQANALLGPTGAYELWLDSWSEQVHSYDELRLAYAEMFFVLPGDDLYPVKQQVRLALFEEDASLTLRLAYHELEDLLSAGDRVQAASAYKDYQVQFSKLLDQGHFDDAEQLSVLTLEYGLLERILRENEIFYDLESIALLSELEKRILTLVGSSQDVDEERLAFVQSKIRFLSRIFSFVEDQSISVEEASKLASELLFDANSYLNSLESDVAVSSYFASTLSDFDLQLSYIESPEFASIGSFDEGFERFKNKVSDLEELNDYLQEIRSSDADDESSGDVEAVLMEVEEDLLLAGILFNQVQPLGDSELRLFEIQNGRLAGIDFEAKYDRSTRILYDIVVEDLRFSTGLSLDDFGQVLQNVLAESSVQDSGVQEQALESGVEAQGQSLAEGVALQSAMDAFEVAGFEGFEFELLDLESSHFLFDGEWQVSGELVLLSGNFELSSGLVSEVLWELDGEVNTLPDLALDNLEVALEAFVQAAI